MKWTIVCREKQDYSFMCSDVMSLWCCFTRRMNPAGEALVQCLILARTSGVGLGSPAIFQAVIGSGNCSY